MRAVILAAGQGRRLGPLGRDRPKCLVEVAGTTVLDHQLHVLRGSGVDEIAIVTGYRADALARRGLRTFHNAGFATTNMVASLFHARDMLRGRDDVVIAYGDILYERRVLSRLMACDAPVAITIDLSWHRYWSARMTDPLQDAETLKLDVGDRVIELGKRPSGLHDIQGQYMGLIKIRADHLGRLCDAYDAMDRDATYDGQPFGGMYMTSFLQHLIDTGWAVHAVGVHNGWLEVDTEDDVQLYDELHNGPSIGDFFRLDT